MATALTTFVASRLNPDLVNEVDPVGRFVAIDETNGNDWINIDNRMIVIIKNTTANPMTCTFTAVSTYSGIDLPDEEVIIPANQLCIIGPWPNKDFGGGGAKTTVDVQYSGTSPVGKILILDVKQNDA
ncbi:MAG: hypothetical protein QQN65_03255 [Nitrosopumilus sp.]